MPTDTNAYQLLIIGLLKQSNKGFYTLLEGFDTSSFEEIDYDTEIENFKTAYHIDLSEHVDEYEIYKSFTESIDEGDMGDIDESYFSGDEDDPNYMLDAYDRYIDDWFETQHKVVDYIKANGGNDLIVLFLRQDFRE